MRGWLSVRCNSYECHYTSSRCTRSYLVPGSLCACHADCSSRKEYTEYELAVRKFVIYIKVRQ